MRIRGCGIEDFSSEIFTSKYKYDVDFSARISFALVHNQMLLQQCNCFSCRRQWYLVPVSCQFRASFVPVSCQFRASFVPSCSVILFLVKMVLTSIVNESSWSNWILVLQSMKMLVEQGSYMP